MLTAQITTQIWGSVSYWAAEFNTQVTGMLRFLGSNILLKQKKKFLIFNRLINEPHYIFGL